MSHSSVGTSTPPACPSEMVTHMIESWTFRNGTASGSVKWRRLTT
ncbi:hypothetical protein ACFH04_03630 [Streptomyces noboritoensis]|uniref:Uncharacterized protein n=1 Tax=Streptomyces noboritoensis TaxID=67337 RepID=A0ABV6TAM3_9ACTN